MGTADDIYRFPWHLITAADASRYFALACTRYTNHKSRENLLGVVRKVTRICAQLDLIPAGECLEILQALPVHACRNDRRPGREIPDSDLRRALRAIASDRREWLRRRDTAIVGTLLSTGMRACELCELTLADWDPTTRSLFIRKTKPGAALTVYLNTTAARWLEAFLDVRGAQPGPLFPPFKQPFGQHMRPNSLLQMLERRSNDAALAHPLRPHDFRRTFATRMLREYDPALVARLLGHRNLSTTARYDRRTEDEDRLAVERIELPQVEDEDGLR